MLRSAKSAFMFTMIQPKKIHWRDNPEYEKILILYQTRSVCFRGHSHIECSHSLRQTDVSEWVYLSL